MHEHRSGILGCGVISRTYIADIRAFFPALRIAACADIYPAAAERCAGEFGIERACTPEELLNDPDVGIVVDLTPPQAHGEMNRRIVSAGKHLFSEKPFAPSLSEAREVLELARKNGVRVGSAPDTFLSSGLQSVRYYLDAGIIGRPFFVTANMTTFGSETWHPSPEAFYKKGAGPVMDMAPYYLSAMVSLLGPIRTISAMSTSADSTRRVYTGDAAGALFRSEVPTHYSALLRMGEGILANLNVSFDIYHSSLPRFEICGTGGTLAYPDPNMSGGTPTVYRREQYTDAVYRKDAWAGARKERWYELPEVYPRPKDYSRGIGVMELAASVDRGEEPRTGGAFLLHITEALEGLIRSAEEGKPYEMTTDCRIPRPVAHDGFPSDLL